MSTYLHRNAGKRQLPTGERSLLVSPVHLFRSSASPHARLSRLLVLLSVVCHLCLLYVIHLIPNNFALTGHFVMAFLLAELAQLLLLLYLAHILVHVQWLAGIDPDNNAIPFMTALADLLGSALLAILFMYLRAVERIF
jgi:solute carrier family 41